MIFADDECRLCPNVKISRQQVEEGEDGILYKFRVGRLAQ